MGVSLQELSSEFDLSGPVDFNDDLFSDDANINKWGLDRTKFPNSSPDLFNNSCRSRLNYIQNTLNSNLKISYFENYESSFTTAGLTYQGMNNNNIISVEENELYTIKLKTYGNYTVTIWSTDSSVSLDQVYNAILFNPNSDHEITFEGNTSDNWMSASNNTNNQHMYNLDIVLETKSSIIDNTIRISINDEGSAISGRPEATHPDKDDPDIIDSINTTPYNEYTLIATSTSK